MHPFSRAFAQARPNPLILKLPLGCSESSFKNTGIPNKQNYFCEPAKNRGRKEGGGKGTCDFRQDWRVQKWSVYVERHFSAYLPNNKSWTFWQIHAICLFTKNLPRKRKRKKRRRWLVTKPFTFAQGNCLLRKTKEEEEHEERGK